MSRFAKALNKAQRDQQKLTAAPEVPAAASAPAQPQQHTVEPTRPIKTRDIPMRILAVVMVAMSFLVLYHLIAAVSTSTAARHQISELNSTIENQQKQLTSLTKRIEEKDTNSAQVFKKLSVSLAAINDKIDAFELASEKKLKKATADAQNTQSVLQDLKFNYQQLTNKISELNQKIDEATKPVSVTSGGM